MVVLHHCGVVVAGSYSRSALQCDMLCTHVGKRYVDVREGRRPRRREGFALIRLLTAGICNISNEEAVFVEPLAAACEILDQAKIPDGAEVAILGDGKLGLLIAQALHAHGYNVHLHGRHKEKLRIARLAGVQTILVAQRLPEAAYDWVVEATGSWAGLRQAIPMTLPAVLYS